MHVFGIHFALILYMYVVNMRCSSAKRFSPPAETGNGEQDETERDPGIPWHPSLDAVVKCIPGKRHPRFPACLCGQYARKVTDEELREKDEDEMKLLHMNLKGRRNEYYECMWCTMCPDGVIMTDRCRQSHDTQCDEDFKCQDPDHVFDDRIKACRQREDLTPEMLNGDAATIDHTSATEATTNKRVRVVQQNTEGLKLISTQPNWFHIATIAAIAVGILVGFELLVFLGYLACKKKRCLRSVDKAPSTTSLDSAVATDCSCMIKKVETSV